MISKSVFFKTIAMIAFLPALCVMFMPYNYSSWWWIIIISISFLSGIIFSIFDNKTFFQKENITFTFNILKKTIYVYNLASISILAIFFILILGEKDRLSIANTIALLSAIIVSIRIIRIDVKDNLNR